MDGKCSYCSQAPLKKEWENPDTYVDDRGNIRVKEPVELVKYIYYECDCGMRYSSEEVKGGKTWWENVYLKSCGKKK